MKPEKNDGFIIDYQTGVTHELETSEAMDLDDAKKIAEDNMAYTQESIYILRDGEQVTYSRWYGVLPDDDDSDVLKVIGNGYFANWIDLD